MPKLPLSQSKAVYFIVLLALTACSRPNKDELKVLETMNESIETANKSIARFTYYQLKNLEEKSYRPESIERAKLWLPKANLIAEFSKIRYDFIERKISKEKLSNTDLEEIFKTLVEYKKEVLGRDFEIKETFKDQFDFINKFQSLISSDTSSQKISIKESLSEKFIKSVLRTLQNDIKKIENETISFCNQKVGGIIDDFYSYSTIVGQSSSVLKPGDMLEVIAGVGAFSKAAQPLITFNGRKKEVNEEDYSSFKTRVPDKPGKYQITVRIDYFDQTIGKDLTKETNVEYTVIEPCDN